MNEKCVLHYFTQTYNQGQPYYFYITCLCTSFSLDELILLFLLQFTSLSFVVHVVWELFIVFDHMILILKSYALIVRTKKSLEKGINNHLTTIYQPIMNTLVHIIRFCTRESVAHAQKEHKVQPQLIIKFKFK